MDERRRRVRGPVLGVRRGAPTRRRERTRRVFLPSVRGRGGRQRRDGRQRTDVADRYTNARRSEGRAWPPSVGTTTETRPRPGDERRRPRDKRPPRNFSRCSTRSPIRSCRRSTTGRTSCARGAGEWSGVFRRWARGSPSCEDEDTTLACVSRRRQGAQDERHRRRGEQRRERRHGRQSETMRREAFREKVREADTVDGLASRRMVGILYRVFCSRRVRVARLGARCDVRSASSSLTRPPSPRASRERPRVEHLSDPSEILQFDVDLFLLVRGSLLSRRSLTRTVPFSHSDGATNTMYLAPRGWRSRRCSPLSSSAPAGDPP